MQKIFYFRNLLLCIGFLLPACAWHLMENPNTLKNESAPAGTDYVLTPVPIKNIRLTDSFWSPIIKKVQGTTIEYAIAKCKEEGRFDNFLIAGGKMTGETKGHFPFDDSDVYKIIEGASNSLLTAPNAPLEKLLDSLIDIVKIGQENDGYLTTWRTIDPANPPAAWVKVDKGIRWESLAKSHELYNAGHLYEAAAVHFKATGKKSLLNIALKNADLMVKTFGDNDGQIKAVPGHQIIESGLIQLYSITKNTHYLHLAKYFLDNRGNRENHELYGSYSQDHLPLTDQEEVVGHAVRAVYMYAAMTDIAAINKDAAYSNAVHQLWNNMVGKKMYITGGIGSKHDGESFGANYELPNLTAYSETCASIGDVYWNHRLNNLTADAKYFDVIERTLYNSLIAGLSLDGKQFFYQNALESDGIYKFNRGQCTRQSWFDCSCCPTNLIRFIPSIPGLLYSKSASDIFVNLYASSEAEIELPNNVVHVLQAESYLLKGKVELTVNAEKSTAFSIQFRIPGWAGNEVLPGNLYHYMESLNTKPIILVNNKAANYKVKNGYAIVNKIWKKGDKVSLQFPMSVKKVICDKNVETNRGKVALEYGPIVYAIEEVDNKNGFDKISVSSTDKFKVSHQSHLLGGVNIIETEKLIAIPYYAWSNRQVGKMKVWIPFENL
ncbi:MAG: beta-L-arabinofuranosidase domain-containing protein [Chitinophagaceae bacterium]